MTDDAGEAAGDAAGEGARATTASRDAAGNNTQRVAPTRDEAIRGGRGPAEQRNGFSMRRDTRAIATRLHRAGGGGEQRDRTSEEHHRTTPTHLLFPLTHSAHRLEATMTKTNNTRRDASGDAAAVARRT